MHALLRSTRNAACSSTCRASSSTLSTTEPSTLRDVARLRVVLAEALESLQYVGESARQAYLETDPAHRDLPESYNLRYLSFARDHVEQALSQYNDFSQSLGPEKMREIERSQSNFALVVADTLLAKDRLKAQIRADEARIQMKKSDGLSRADLTFCDGPG